jgi:hypothetical protein
MSMAAGAHYGRLIAGEVIGVYNNTENPTPKV